MYHVTMTQNTIDPLATLATAPEVAEMYGLTRTQLYYALHNGLIKARRVGRTWLIDVRDLPDVWPTRAPRSRRRAA